MSTLDSFFIDLTVMLCEIFGSCLGDYYPIDWILVCVVDAVNSLIELKD